MIALVIPALSECQTPITLITLITLISLNPEPETPEAPCLGPHFFVTSLESSKFLAAQDTSLQVGASETKPGLDSDGKKVPKTAQTLER